MKTIVRSLPRRSKFLRGNDSLIVGYPWLTYGAIMALEEIVKPDFAVLELGCGGSTVFWARRCGLVWSFETNKEWAEKTQEAIRDYPNAAVVYGPINIQHEWADNSFDIVLIDHKDYTRRRTDRLPLALVAIPKLKVGGWLVVDNYAAFGMDKFDYANPMWDVYTFDDVRWKGRGTRLCKRLK